MSKDVSNATTVLLEPVQPIPGNPYLVMIVPHEEGLLQAEAMETWFQACSTDTPFALELVGTQKEQGFVLRASSEDQLIFLSKQLQGQYPQAELERIAPAYDPLVLRASEHAVIGEFTLVAPNWMPIKTFSGKALAEPGADPLAGLLAAMETVQSSERVICQLALVRAPESWIASDIRKAVEHPLQGERDKAAVHARGYDANPNAAGVRLVVCLVGFLAILYGSRLYQQSAWFPLALLCIGVVCALIGLLVWWIRRQNTNIYDMKLVSEKLMRAAFYTQLRVMVIGQEKTATEERLQTVILQLETAYRQFTLASANGFSLKQIRHVKPQEKRARVLPHPFSAFPYHHPLLRFLHGGAPGKDVCNGLELSGAFHLPQEMTDLPLVRRIAVKRLLFSPEVANTIATQPATLPPVFIGHSKQRGYAIPVHLPFATLFSHKFLIGRSRSGKSVLMQLMIRGAMQHVLDRSPQPGLFVIDPHHDLIEDLLGIIPPERVNDVLLLDFTDTDYPVGLNPLDASMGFTRDQAVSNLMSCFERVWSEFWGPRMSYFLKSVCLLLYTLNQKLVAEGRADEQYTILDINPLLQYQDYAIQVLHDLDMSETWHQELLAWWEHTYFTLPKQSSFRQEVILPILSKIGVFNDNQVLRRIVGQPLTTAPIHEAITRGKIVLCALSSRDLDDASVNILGSTLINLLHRAFATQQHLALTARRKVFVAIDELQNFSGSMFDKLLSEDAKYGCSMLLSTQNLKRLNQIKDGLLEMMLSNCENLCAFSVSAADAKILEEEFQKKVTQKHIISLPRLQCYARLAIAGYPIQLASLHVAQPASWTKDMAQATREEAIRKGSRAGRLDALRVDEMHSEHLNRFLDVRHFAERFNREARGRDQSRKQQEEATIRAEQADHIHVTPGKRPDGESTPEPSSHLPTWSPVASTAPAAPTSTSAGSTSNEDARQDAVEQESSGDGNRRKNHNRSSRRENKLKKVNKSPVGTSPAEFLQKDEDVDTQRPVVPLSGGVSWGREGRERERGG